MKAVDVDSVERDGKLDSSYEPFLTEGLISIMGKSTKQVRIKMLRDTGIIKSFVVAGVLPFSEQTSCGSNVLVQGIEMGLVKVPLHQVHLQSELCTGFVKVGVHECLPVKGVEFILGNDLAGGKVFPVLEVFDNPVLDQADELSEMYPEILLLELKLVRKMSLICPPLLLHLYLPMTFYCRLKVRLLKNPLLSVRTV